MQSKNAQTLGVHVSNDIAEMIVLRAKARGVTKSRYAAMIFEKWRADKFPALDTVDSTARAVVNQTLNDKKSRAMNVANLPDDTPPQLIPLARKPLRRSEAQKLHKKSRNPLSLKQGSASSGPIPPLSKQAS